MMLGTGGLGFLVLCMMVSLAYLTLQLPV